MVTTMTISVDIGKLLSSWLNPHPLPTTEASNVRVSRSDGPLAHLRCASDIRPTCAYSGVQYTWGARWEAGIVSMCSVYIYIYVYVYVSVYTCSHIHIWMYVYMYVYACVYVCV